MLLLNQFREFRSRSGVLRLMENDLGRAVGVGCPVEGSSCGTPKTIVCGKQRSAVQKWCLNSGPLGFLISRNYVPKFGVPKLAVGRFWDGYTLDALPEDLALAHEIVWASPVVEVLLLKCLIDRLQLPKPELILGFS